MKINTVLFDLDGTLLDTNHLVVESFQHVYRNINKEEKPVQEIKSFFGEPIKMTLEREFDVPFEESVKIYREYHYKVFDELIDIFPGMKELIIELDQKNYKLGVVTSRLRNTTIKGLEKYGLTEYFKCIITASDSTKHKPDPEPIEMALKELGSKPEEALMIGDSIFDIKCAKNSGVKSAIVDWAEASKEVLLAENPDFEIKKASDVIEILEKINRSE